MWVCGAGQLAACMRVACCTLFFIDPNIVCVCVCVCSGAVRASVLFVRILLHGFGAMSNKEMVSTETGQCLPSFLPSIC